MRDLWVLNHGYVRLVEAWGGGDAGLPEAGIIEAARQSTQGRFRSWDPYKVCTVCEVYFDQDIEEHDHRWKDYPKGDVGLLDYLMRNKHLTPFEFAGMTIEVQAPIFVIREWQRHRTFSYNEMSARYGRVPELDYLPETSRVLASDAKNKQAQAEEGKTLSEAGAKKWLEELEGLQQHAQSVYESALEAGVPKELARCALTVARYSRMRVSGNLRNWLAFIDLRTDEAAQWEIRQYGNAVAHIVAETFRRTWSCRK